MTEKYKIYLSEDIKSRLTNDAELFEFFKKDGSVNLNAFLKALIVNYFDRYRHSKEQLLANIRQDILNTVSISDIDSEVLADKIVNTYLKGYIAGSEKSTAITLTVGGESYDTIRIIENNMLKDSSLSQYLKDMFVSYLSIPRNSREAIIFKNTYETITEAISEKKVISFSSSTNASFVVEPYLIAPSKEEQCNYLICNDVRAHRPRSFRISRLSSVFITADNFIQDPELYESLREKAMRSPHSVSDTVRAVVKLTPYGAQKFKVITKNRPDVLKKDGDLYCFDWPEQQLEDYFLRFGRDAIVLEPKSLRNRLKKYYRMAIRAYQDQRN